jgi:hypothetical protein
MPTVNKPVSKLVVGVFVMAFCSSLEESRAEAVSTVYVATMNGAQTVPPRQTQSTGVVQFSLDASNRLSGTVKFSNLESSQLKTVKLEMGGCGEQPTAPRYTLEPPNSQGVINVNGINLSEFANELKTGKMYIILRTSARPAGEIRGQLYKQGATTKCPAP